MTTPDYTGPAYWTVTATSEHSWDLLDMSGRRVATYPNAEKAHKARVQFERAAMREYLKQGKAK